MVYNPAMHISFPFSRSKMRAITRKMSGTGTGSVLLSKGGPGAASSYQDIDDYIKQTGINPYARASITKSSTPSGMGLKSITEKLSKLSAGAKPKMKNIKLSL